MTSDNHRIQEALNNTKKYKDFDDSEKALQAINSDLREMLVYLSMLDPQEENCIGFNGRVSRILLKMENLLANHTSDDPILRRHLSIRLLCGIFLEIV